MGSLPELSDMKIRVINGKCPVCYSYTKTPLGCSDCWMEAHKAYDKPATRIGEGNEETWNTWAHNQIKLKAVKAWQK